MENDSLNRLLLDFNKSQAEVIKHLRNMVIIICVCFTVIFSVFICGFFWYEAQFDKTTTTITQEAEVDEGDALLNNSGVINYGNENKTNSND